MDFLVKLFYALLFILSGIGILKYRRVVKGWTGNFVWAEKYIGNGGTYFVITLMGMILIFLGVLYPFGGLDAFIGDNSNYIKK